MTTKMSSRGLSLVAVTLFLIAWSGATSAAVVGELILPVELRGGDPEAIYALERQKTDSGPCALDPDLSFAYVQLCTGDRIEIKDRSGYVQIRFNGSQRLTRVEQRSSPYAISARPGARAPIDVLFNKVWELLKPFENAPGEDTIMLMARASAAQPITVPMLDRFAHHTGSKAAAFACGSPSSAGGEACEMPLIQAGYRSLALIWSGGRPPFAISIEREDGRQLAHSDGLQTSLFQSESRRFEPGRYLLTVSDADGPEGARLFPFRVVSREQMPMPSSKLALKDEGHQALADVIFATWLADQDDVWIWDGFTRVMPYVGAFPPAAALASHLGRGIAPRRTR
ncbi:MAG: hypothetical protein AAGA73_01085 [Pseudomonadota bacterium]